FRQLLQDAEIEDEMGLRIEATLDGDASAVVVAVQRLAAVAGERDEMGGREDEVVLRHRYAKLTARRHGPNFLHRPAMSSERRSVPFQYSRKRYAAGSDRRCSGSSAGQGARRGRCAIRPTRAVRRAVECGVDQGPMRGERADGVRQPCISRDEK